jgi:hypothetical protein
VVDDINRTQVGNSSAAKDTVTVTQPIWPTETDLVYVTGTNKVKLSLQSRLLQAIFKDAFENVRRDLLFEHAFPDAVAIPAVVRKALVSAAEANTFCDGRYNASAAAVTRGLRVLREQLFLRLLLTTCRASKYTLDLESCLGTLRQS